MVGRWTFPFEKGPFSGDMLIFVGVSASYMDRWEPPPPETNQWPTFLKSQDHDKMGQKRVYKIMGYHRLSVVVSCFWFLNMFGRINHSQRSPALDSKVSAPLACAPRSWTWGCEIGRPSSKPTTSDPLRSCWRWSVLMRSYAILILITCFSASPA